MAWVAPRTPPSAGGSVLTLQNVPGQFDAIVLGELEPGRWMAGSEFFRRTSHDQKSWPAESAAPGKLVQVAVTYRGKERLALARRADLCPVHDGDGPREFDQTSVALLGLRHLEVAGGATFVGEIADARIYPGRARRGGAGLAPSGSARRAPPAGLVDLRGRTRPTRWARSRRAG